MITKELLQQVMNEKQNQESFQELKDNYNRKLDYKAYSVGVIIGSVLKKLKGFEQNREQLETRMQVILDQIKEDLRQLGIEENEITADSLSFGIELVIMAEFLNSEEGRQYTEEIKLAMGQKNETPTPKKEKAKSYEKFETDTLNKIQNLLETEFSKEVENDEVEMLDVAIVVIVNSIAESINHNLNVKECFVNVGFFLEEQLSVDLKTIGKTIATITNPKLKEHSIAFNGTSFEIKQKEDNSQKITRSIDKLLNLSKRV